MSIRRLGVLLVLASVVPVMALAQVSAPEARQAGADSYRWLGAGVSTSFPYTEFSDSHNTGYGLHALLDRPVKPLLNASADIGWNHFSGANGQESVDVWNLIFGARFVLGAFFMGGEVGYLSKVDSWGWVPSLGLRYDQLEFTLRHVAAGADAWTTLRLGWYF